MQRARDVVVIGGGMAGVAAALACAGRGARVTLVQRAPGATALAAGGWLGPLPEPLAKLFSAAGHPWTAVAHLLPGPDGSVRRYQMAAPAQTVPLASTTLVCGVAGLPGFHAPVLARLWSELAGVDAVGETIVLSDTPAAGWSPPSLAAALERNTNAFAERVRERVRATRAAVAIVPAVLGLDESERVRHQASEAVGVPVGEALGVMPSIPGWRMQRALERMLAGSGVNVLRGVVSAPVKDARRLVQVQVRAGSGIQSLKADAFVLATGKFVGGGIVADGRLSEPALECPVWIEHAGEVFEIAEPLTLTNADRREDQPLLEAGVAVDAEGRALGRHGDIVFENVWTAGAVRRGHNAGSTGLGHAASEGWAAGERAAS